MKRIVIVGASSGIGLEVARQFIDKGWSVGIAGRNVEPLEKLCAIDPTRIFAERVDVQDESAPEHLHSLVERMGGMDIYLHSSGIGKQNQELEPTIEIETLRTNGEGFVRMVTAAFNYFRKRGDGGHIAAITSVAGTRSGAAAPSYGATKAMQSNYLGALAQLSNNKKLGIYVTDIKPGFVATPLIGDCPYPMVMEVEYASRKIVKAILSRRRSAIIDFRYALLVFVWRLIPRFLWERIRL